MPSRVLSRRCALVTDAPMLSRLEFAVVVFMLKKIQQGAAVPKHLPLPLRSLLPRRTVDGSAGASRVGDHGEEGEGAGGGVDAREQGQGDGGGEDGAGGAGTGLQEPRDVPPNVGVLARSEE